MKKNFSRSRVLSVAAVAAVGSMYVPRVLAQAFDNTAIVNTALQIEAGGPFAGTQPRISAEGLAGGRTFAGYGALDFSANSFASGNLVSNINTFKITLFDNGLNVTPYGASKPDGFAAAGPVDFYLSSNNGSTATWRPDTNSTSYTINGSTTAGIDLIGNGGNTNTGSAPTLSQLFSLGTLNYVPQPLSSSNIGQFNLDFTSTLGQTLASNTNQTEAQFIAQTISNGGAIRLIIAPKYFGSGTVGTGTAADFVGTLQSFGVNATAPAVELAGTLVAAPTNSSVLNLVDPSNGSNTKTLTLPTINRLWRYGNATSAVTLNVTGITGTNTARYTATGDSTTFNFAGAVPAPSGTSTAIFTMNAGGHSVGPGTTNYTVTGGLQNLDNPGDTNNVSISQMANVLIDTRTVGLNPNPNSTFLTGSGFLTANLNGTNHGVLTGATIAAPIDLATSNPSNINPGSNTLSLVLLSGTQTISFSSATSGTASVSTGNSVIFGSGISQNGTNVTSGTELATRTLTLHAGTKGGSYVDTNRNLGFFSAGPLLTNADDALAVNPVNRGNFSSDAIDYAANVYQTALVTGSSSNSSALVSLLTLSNAAATSNISGGQQIGLRAAAVVTNVSAATAQAGFTISNDISAGTTLTPGTAASGTVSAVLAAGVATATASFNPAGALNGVYSGKIAYGLQHADQLVVGTAPNDLGSKTVSFSATVAGNSGTGQANILPGGTYGSVASPYYINRGGGMNSTISFVGGTATANNTIAVAFGTSGATRAVSDNVAITGNGGDAYVAQLTYDPTVSTNGPALGWYNGTTYVNATNGSSDGGSSSSEVLGAYDGNATLGRYGIDRTNHVVWAVVDGTGTFVSYNRLQGDTKFRGTVGAVDLFTVKHNYGNFDGTTTIARWSDGDFTGSGQVGAQSLFLVKHNYGTFAEPGGTSPAVQTALKSQTLTAGPATQTDTIELDVNTATGDVQMIGTSALLGNYDIGSKSGALSTAGWVKLQGTRPAGEGWGPAGPVSSKDVSESSAVGQYASLGTIDLGNLYAVGGAHDLVFQYGTDQSFFDSSSGSNPATGGAVVTYVSTPEPTVMSLIGLGAIGLLARRRKTAR